MTIPKQKKWILAESLAPDTYVERLQKNKVHPILAQIMYKRGYLTPDDALAFFELYNKDDNPFRLKGVTEAVYRLRMAIRHKEPIVVYGDFDCDGVTATTLLTEVLQKLGADVRPYIPDRVDEGYGLNSKALETLANDGARVVITVDCGIRSVKEVEDANGYGLDMIITDHHSVGEELPPALAIINPKQADCSYPESMLAGVGIAYKVAQGLYMEAQRRGYRGGDGWRPDDWLDLVAIGTVADIAPLTGENRVLVTRGLELLNQPKRLGLNALYDEAGIKQGSVDASTIGFRIGPRINAAGRLKSAGIACDLLSASNPEDAQQLAKELNQINILRQEKTADMQIWAEDHFSGDPEDEALLFAADERFEQGIVGLVASRLTEQYYRPSVVLQVGETESHASCRSIPEFHVTQALEQCADILTKFGGHAAAAGFTVENQYIDELAERLWHIAAEDLAEIALIPSIEIDSLITLGEVDFKLIHSLNRLEPTGEANPKPLFAIEKLRIKDKKTVGAENSHLKLVLTDGTDDISAIAFRWGDRLPEEVEVIDVACYVEINEWNGRSNLQLNIQDIRWTE